MDKMAETLESLIGTSLLNFLFPFFWFIVVFTYIRNLVLDKATDPVKSKEGVDYMTPVYDRINLDLDGWDFHVYFSNIVQ